MTVNFVIVDNGQVNIADMEATIARDLKVANERFAQVGVEIVKGGQVVSALPSGLTLPNGNLVIEQPLGSSGNPTLTADVKSIIETLGTKDNLEDIHVFYVAMTLIPRWGSGSDDDGCDGVAVNIAYNDENEGYLYNVFMTESGWPFALAHELGHILTDGGHFAAMEAAATKQPNPGIYRTNLMYDGMLFDGSFFDGKRLLDIQETAIHASRHAKPIKP